MRRKEKQRILQRPVDDVERAIAKLLNLTCLDEKFSLWKTEHTHFLEDEEFVIKAIHFNHGLFASLPNHYYSNRRVCFAAVSICGSNLRFCDKKFKSDKEFAMKALEHLCDRYVMKFIDKSLLYDMEVLLQALRGNMHTCEFFPQDLMTIEFQKEIILMYPKLIERHPQFHNDRDLITLLLRKNPSVLSLLDRKNSLRCDMEFLHSLQDPRVWHFFPAVFPELSLTREFFLNTPNHNLYLMNWSKIRIL